MDSNLPTEPLILEPGAATAALDALKLRLAAQVAPAGWGRVFRRMADSVESGVTLESSVHQNQASMNPELHCLMSEALKVADPTGLVVEAVRIRVESRRAWHEFLAMVAYPCILFVFALGIGIFFSFFMKSVVDVEWMEEWGLPGTVQVQSTLADQHNSILGLALITGWVLLVLATIAVLGPPWALTAVLGGLAVIGKPLRWISLQEIIARFQLFISQGMPTSEAATATADSFNRGSQSIVVKSIAQRIQGGVPLGKSLAASMLTDGLCRPVLRALDQHEHDLPNAMRKTAELLGKLATQHCRALSTMLPVFVLIMVGTIIWATITSYLQMLVPLLTMITSLA